MRVLLYVAVMTFASTLVACNKERASDSDTSALANSGYAWAGGKVDVCFINEPKNVQLQKMVQVVLQSNYQSNSTGIEFSGFQSCQMNPKAPARLYFSEGRAYSKYIGTYKIPQPMPHDDIGATIVVADSNNEFYAYNTILHEFGHFAGLFHEQSRMENINGDLCSRQEYGGLAELEAQLPGSYPKQLGAFDRMSIMNYCIQGYFSQYLKLSSGDVTALRALYTPSATSPVRNNPNNPAELCNIVEIVPWKETNGDLSGTPGAYSADGKQVPAFADERFNQDAFAGMLAVGTRLSRLLTKPMYMEVASKSANLTAIQAIPQSGPLANKKVWLLGNVTKVVDCRTP